jgi:ABC-type oligopeptide transport system substrate-binding subunit
MPFAPLRTAVKLALLAALVVAVPGCRQRDDGTVNVTVIGSKPRLVDPASGLARPSDEVLLSAVAQGLVQFDARGEIEPGLAERWNVSDDGLSYIFRLTKSTWPSGRPITAKDIVRLFKRQIAAASHNPIKDTVGAIAEVVAMTDRVIEIRLLAPRPNLLQLLAQPEFGLLRGNEGSGPFRLSDKPQPGDLLRLSREVPGPDGDQSRREVVFLSGSPAAPGIRAFAEKKEDLLLGGSFVDLPLTRTSGLPRNALRFDPVAGLFGLVPARKGGPLGERDVRLLLSQAIDRDALIAALAVPDLTPRATTLQPGLEGLGTPVAPAWLAEPAEARRARLVGESNRLFGNAERPVLRIALPEGPGARILFDRLARDWAPFGIRVAPAAKGMATDLRLVDAVAPSTSPAWFLREFRCGTTPICDPKADELLDAARAAPIAAQRSALFAEAARMMDNEILFLPIAAPIRWSLVSPSVSGFALNRFGRHPLIGLKQKLSRERAD